MHLSARIPRNTKSMQSLNKYVWEHEDNALWDTVQHILLDFPTHGVVGCLLCSVVCIEMSTCVLTDQLH